MTTVKNFVVAARRTPRVQKYLACVLLMLGIVTFVIESMSCGCGRPSDARISAAKTDISNLSTALELYQNALGDFPSTSQGLRVLVTPPPGEHGPELPFINQLPIDPWQHPYVYRRPGSNGKPFDLFSYGPDGKLGGGDDISN